MDPGNADPALMLAPLAVKFGDTLIQSWDDFPEDLLLLGSASSRPPSSTEESAAFLRSQPHGRPHWTDVLSSSGDELNRARSSRLRDVAQALLLHEKASPLDATDTPPAPEPPMWEDGRHRFAVASTIYERLGHVDLGGFLAVVRFQFPTGTDSLLTAAPGVAEEAPRFSPPCLLVVGPFGVPFLSDPSQNFADTFTAQGLQSFLPGNIPVAEDMSPLIATLDGTLNDVSPARLTDTLLSERASTTVFWQKGIKLCARYQSPATAELPVDSDWRFFLASIPESVELLREDGVPMVLASTPLSAGARTPGAWQLSSVFPLPANHGLPIGLVIEVSEHFSLPQFRSVVATHWRESSVANTAWLDNPWAHAWFASAAHQPDAFITAVLQVPSIADSLQPLLIGPFSSPLIERSWGTMFLQMKAALVFDRAVAMGFAFPPDTLLTTKRNWVTRFQRYIKNCNSIIALNAGCFSATRLLPFLARNPLALLLLRPAVAAWLDRFGLRDVYRSLDPDSWVLRSFDTIQVPVLEVLKPESLPELVAAPAERSAEALSTPQRGAREQAPGTQQQDAASGSAGQDELLFSLFGVSADEVQASARRATTPSRTLPSLVRHVPPASTSQVGFIQEPAGNHHAAMATASHALPTAVDPARPSASIPVVAQANNFTADDRLLGTGPGNPSRRTLFSQGSTVGARAESPSIIEVSQRFFNPSMRPFKVAAATTQVSSRFIPIELFPVKIPEGLWKTLVLGQLSPPNPSTEKFRFTRQGFQSNSLTMAVRDLAILGAFSLGSSASGLLSPDALPDRIPFGPEWRTCPGVIGSLWATQILQANSNALDAVVQALCSMLGVSECRGSPWAHVIPSVIPSFPPSMFNAAKYPAFFKALQSGTVSSGLFASQWTVLPTSLTIWHFLPTIRDCLDASGKIPASGLPLCDLSKLAANFLCLLSEIYADPSYLTHDFPAGHSSPFTLCSPFVGVLLSFLRHFQSPEVLRAWNQRHQESLVLPKAGNAGRRLTLAFILSICQLVQIMLSWGALLSSACRSSCWGAWTQDLLDALPDSQRENASSLPPAPISLLSESHHSGTLWKSLQEWLDSATNGWASPENLRLKYPKLTASIFLNADPSLLIADPPDAASLKRKTELPAPSAKKMAKTTGLTPAPAPAPNPAAVRTPGPPARPTTIIRERDPQGESAQMRLFKIVAQQPPRLFGKWLSATATRLRAENRRMPKFGSNNRPFCFLFCTENYFCANCTSPQLPNGRAHIDIHPDKRQATWSAADFADLQAWLDHPQVSTTISLTDEARAYFQSLE